MTTACCGWGRLLGLCLVGVGALPSQAIAQARTSGEPSRRAELTSQANVFGGFDQSLTGSRGIVATGARTSSYGGVDSKASFAKTFESGVAFVANATAALRYFPQARTSWIPSSLANLSLSSRDGARLSWSASQSLVYGPSNGSQLFGGIGSPAGLFNVGTNGLPADQVDYQLANARELASYTSANVGVALSRRTSVEASGGGGYTVGTLGNTQRFARISGGIRTTHKYSRYGSLRLGYRYDDSRALNAVAGASGVRAMHSLDTGIDYSRTLPFSPETRVSFSSGVAALPRGSSWDVTAVGNAFLAQPLGRRFVATVGGERTSRFMPIFPDPVLSNSVVASIDGAFGRRLVVTGGGGFSTGSTGFDVSLVDFEAYSGQLRALISVSNHLGFQAEYYIFRADFTGSVPSFLGAGARSRHGVRVGATVGTNLLRRR